jgi:hypothetical protein
VVSYSRQTAICESVREMIRQALAKSHELSVKLRTSDIPTTDSILRTVSVLLPSIDNEEQLKDFIIDHVLASLHMTTIQKEHLSLNS